MYTADAKDISLEQLRSLGPLHTLKDASLLKLRETALVQWVPQDIRLWDSDRLAKWVVFLLEGELELVDENAIVQRVRAGTIRARQPVLSPSPTRTDVTATEASKVLYVDRTLYYDLREADRETDYLVSDMQVDGIESDIFQKIYFAYDKGQLVLPSMPDVALRVRKALMDPRSNVTQVARIIQTDAPIALRLIQIANSPFYRGQAQVANVREAVVRLGTEVTRNIVTSFALRQLFKVQTPMLGEMIQTLWDHSTYVGALAFVLARLTPGFDAERALLAGLVHDIGVVPILAYADAQPSLLEDLPTFELAVQHLRGMIGGIVLEKWSFDRELVKVAVEAEDWFRDPSPEADYCDLVLIAQLHSYVGTPAMQHLPRINEVPAFGKLALGKLTPQLSIHLLDDAKDDITAVRRLLT
ncbi:MAG: HDOD domain-containing protein [Chromatiales bacterium]|jgi:HD-like signal output (HDOD) protein|nr:HDOD domain-containing protein [Chromatiales bacterium]MDX9767052.1 HDOD domain-containing protein [Ectothiorhodospiraceae bacterium]